MENRNIENEVFHERYEATNVKTAESIQEALIHSHRQGPECMLNDCSLDVQINDPVATSEIQETRDKNQRLENEEVELQKMQADVMEENSFSPLEAINIESVEDYAIPALPYSSSSVSKYDELIEDPCAETISSLNRDADIARFSKKLAVCSSCKNVIGNAEIVKLLSVLHSRRVDLIRSLGYACEICPLITIDREQFEGHQLQHIFNGQAYCIKCREQIVYRAIEPMFGQQKINDLIRVQMKSGRGRNIRFSKRLYTRWPPRCGECGHIFDYITTLIHKILEFPSIDLPSHESYYTCCLCDLQGDDVDEMECHVINHIDAGEILCKCCKQVADNEKQFQSLTDHAV